MPHSSSLTHGYISKRTENICPHKSLHINVHSHIIHNSQNVETTQMSINNWMQSLYTVNYYSVIKVNEMLIHATRWMDIKKHYAKWKKTEHRTSDAFALRRWRRILRIPWTARGSNRSILKKSSLNIHWKDWCWSWSSNNLATWCKQLTQWKRPWCWERLKAKGEEGNREWEG